MTSQLFDVVEEEPADGGAHADVVRERPDDGQDRRLHFWICRQELMIKFFFEIMNFQPEAWKCLHLCQISN